MLGKGGAFTLISTGEQTAADLGINYTPSNIIVQTTGALSSGNVRVSMTTPSTSATTGALQVMGGVGVKGSLHTDGLINTTGNIICASISAGTYIGLSAQRINQDASNVIVTTSFVNVAVNGSNVAAFSATGLILNVNNNAQAIRNAGTSGVGNIGASGAAFNTVFATATTALYADLAEKYLADAEYSPGTVMHFGGEQEVSICDVDMCSRVAGVVSTQPGYVMNEGLSGEHVVILALTGRVPTRVRGPISKGDLMVSAGDGHARAEGLPQVGTVIGKALEDFDGDSGVIEVVVGKH
jgi:hypothetical protein